MRLLIVALTISVVICLSLFLKVSEPTAKTVVSKPYIPPTSVPYVADTEDDLFQTVNEWRVQTNRLAYKKSAIACELAEKRLPQVRANWDAGHQGFYELLKSMPPGNTLSENLAIGFIFKDRTLNGWLNSPSHKENLDKPYTHSCIKCDSGYCVQIFSY